MQFRLLLLSGLLLAFTNLFSQSNDFALYGSFVQTAGGQGAVYAINPDGTGYQAIKEFPNNPDGQNPVGKILLTQDGYAYGVCQGGGTGNGIIFEMNQDGTGFHVIYSFIEAILNPAGNLVLGNNGFLFGTTQAGGPNDGGTIYKVKRDGSEYTTVYEFSGTHLGDGVDLTIDADGTIYGIGSNRINHNSIFKLSADGASFTVLHEFPGMESPRFVNGSVLLASNDFIYGTSRHDGANETGTIFRIKKDGTSFSTVFDFPAITSDGGTEGNLIELDGFIYSTISSSGTLVFKVDLDGTGYTVVSTLGLEFGGSSAALSTTADGDLIVANYRTEIPTVVKIDLETTDVSLLHTFTETSFVLAPLAVLPNGDLLGTRDMGKESMNGYIYRISSAGDFNVLKEFPQPQGSQPTGNLAMDEAGFLYGITQRGGTIGTGVIYRMKKDGSDYELLGEIDKMPSTNGLNLTYGGLLLASDGFLYGVNDREVTSSGSIYKISKDGQTPYAEIYNFNAGTGGSPTGTLLEGSDEMLYGTTQNGGTFLSGTIYRINKDGSGFQKLHDFQNTGTNGGTLTEGADGYLLGMTQYGGSSQRGFAFRIKMDGGGFEVIKDFDGTTGAAIPGATWLAHPNGRFYAMSTYWQGDQGAIFSIAGNGANFRIEHRFEFLPAYSSLTLSDGYFYGLSYNRASMFRIKDDGTGIEYFGLVPPQSISSPYSLSTNFLVLEKTPQTLTFNLASGATVVDPPITLTATTDSDLPIVFTSSDDEVVTIEGNTMTIVGVGEVTVTATQAGDIFYKSASISHQFIVTKLQQTITFEPLSNLTFGDEGFALEGSSSSELTLAYTSSNEDVATVSGNEVTIVGAGTTTITAKQSGNDIYFAAADVARELTVEKADQTITFADIPDKLMGTAPFEATVTASSELIVVLTTTSDKVTIQGTTVTIVKPGRTTIKADQDGNENYEAAASAEKTFCINPAKPVITAAIDGETVILTSSNETGNAWYRNEVAIDEADQKTLVVTEADVYSVKTTIDDCVSEMSATIPIVVTGIESQRGGNIVYTNPVSETLSVLVSSDHEAPVSLELLDNMGRRLNALDGRTNREEKIHVGGISPGLYLLRVSGPDFKTTKRIVKE